MEPTWQSCINNLRTVLYFSLLSLLVLFLKNNNILFSSLVLNFIFYVTDI